MALVHFAPQMKLSRVEVQNVTARQCPIGCNGFLARIAQREVTYPYHWRVVGWRCTNCGHLSIESKAALV